MDRKVIFPEGIPIHNDARSASKPGPADASADKFADHLVDKQRADMLQNNVALTRVMAEMFKTMSAIPGGDDAIIKHARRFPLSHALISRKMVAS